MLKTLLTCISFCACVIAIAQNKSPEKKVAGEAYRLKIKADSTQDIAQYINQRYTGEVDKVRAIYHWVINNISYNSDSSRIINAGIDPDAKITVAFKRRKGVCENFSAIFNDICRRSGLVSEVINGYTQQSNGVDNVAHSWNAVQVTNVWYFFDPTWDEKNDSHTIYYMIEPKDFIRTHMPFDPLWQLLEYPIQHEQFYKNNFSKNSKTPYFNFQDSIIAYRQMDSLNQLKSAIARIEKMTMPNKRVVENYTLLKSHREMIYQQQQISNFDLAMADLNEATQHLNKFIHWRNEPANNLRPHDSLRDILNLVDNKIKSALVKLEEVDRSKASLVYGTGNARERIEQLLKKNEDQKKFLKQYVINDSFKK
ncbi:MAG: transglutaminase domain-containing protein [Ginsengibacter sp.]